MLVTGRGNSIENSSVYNSENMLVGTVVGILILLEFVRTIMQEK